MKPTFEETYNAVLEEIGIPPKVFKREGKSRVATIARARQMICYVAKELGYDTVFIGQQLGITHAGVIYHHETAQGHIAWERDYSESISNIMHRLGACSTKYKVRGWLTRDKDCGGSLSFTVGEKPERNEKVGMWTIRGKSTMCDAPKDLFPQITWESEPQECEMTLRIKQHE